MLKVFICSPFRGDIKENIKRAVYYAKTAVVAGIIPIAPHLIFPAFLDENIPIERMMGIEMGLELMDICDEVWVFGFLITEGMKLELDHAKEKQIPVRLHDGDSERIVISSIETDNRMADAYRMMISGLRLME